eukprot:GHVS01003201.1.p1 GENE.GHVS01003201.1~~GHVS01003201.1.p1  ORF type:complete len:108 (+),score=16.99 GHVS01003201.1:436-759(+)
MVPQQPAYHHMRTQIACLQNLCTTQLFQSFSWSPLEHDHRAAMSKSLFSQPTQKSADVQSERGLRTVRGSDGDNGGVGVAATNGRPRDSDMAVPTATNRPMAQLLLL